MSIIIPSSLGYRVGRLSLNGQRIDKCPSVPNQWPGVPFPGPSPCFCGAEIREKTSNNQEFGLHESRRFVVEGAIQDLSYIPNPP